MGYLLVVACHVIGGQTWAAPRLVPFVISFELFPRFTHNFYLSIVLGFALVLVGRPHCVACGGFFLCPTFAEVIIKYLWFLLRLSSNI